MRRRVAIVLLTLAGAAPAAAQEGINLSWADCGSMGVSIQTFACNTNTGSPFLLFGSARIGSTLSPVAQIFSTLDLSAEAPSLPPWWQIHEPGTCRQNAVSAGVHAPGPMAACSDWEGGATLDAFLVSLGYGGPNHARLDVGQFIDSGNPRDFPGGVENFLFLISISRQKTVGDGSCPGCAAEACITFRQVEFSYGSFSPSTWQVRTLTVPLEIAAVTWQSATPSCLGAVTQRRTTWGILKTLYR